MASNIIDKQRAKTREFSTAGPLPSVVDHISITASVYCPLSLSTESFLLVNTCANGIWSSSLHCTVCSRFRRRHWSFPITMSLNRAASYFITTPIYYVNSKPHIGHLYSSLLADTIARWQRIKHRQDPRIIFSTGTDEHGLKVERAASNAHLTPIEFCNQVSGRKGPDFFLHECTQGWIFV